MYDVLVTKHKGSTMKKKSNVKTRGKPDGFINIPVSQATRKGLHELKEALNVSSQAEVVEKLVAIGLAISQVSKS